MYSTVHGIVIQTTQYSESSIIAKILTRESGLLSFIYKGIKKSKSKSKDGALLFPGAILAIDCLYNPQKNFQYPQKSYIQHPYFITQESVVKHCIMTFIVEVLKNLLLDGQENTELYDFYVGCLDYMQVHSEKECANLPIVALIKLSEISGYKIINNFSEKNPYCDIENGCFAPAIPTSEDIAWHKNLNYFLGKNDWDKMMSYPLNKDERKKILELYIRFLQLHLMSFTHFKSLDILSIILS